MKLTTLLLAPLVLALPMCAHSGKPVKRSTEELQTAFRRMDRNHDAYLSRDEYLARKKDRNKASRNFARRDRNGDGKLSEQEFVTHITKALR